jgi:perosamine synthetase
MKKIKVFVNEPLLNGNEKKYLLNCFDGHFISSTGRYIDQFEDKFAKKVNRKYAIAVSNGTVALQLAFDSLDIKKNDEIILPSFTIISCILPIIRLGAKPILIDSDIKTWNMDVDKIEKAITKKTKAILVPHIYGLPVDMDPLIKITKKFKLKLIEDAAEVLGLKYKKKPCGSFGDVSTFSFYANKHITTGEGGMIVTDNKKIADKCRSLRNIYFNKFKRFVHHGIGWNARLTNLQASIGLAQLERLDQFIKIKRKIGDAYNKHLVKSENYSKPLDKTSYAKNIYWVYGILIKKKGLSVRRIVKELLQKGIETRPFFWPLHQQPILKKMGLFKNIKLPISELLSQNGFYLPSGLALSKKQQAYVIEKFNKIITS